jgi:hypothetical protein
MPPMMPRSRPWRVCDDLQEVLRGAGRGSTFEVEALPAHRALIRYVATSLRETRATRSMERPSPKARAGERPWP